MNAGAAPLFGLESADPVFRMRPHVDDFVKLPIEPGANETAIFDGKRRIVDDRASDQVDEFRQFGQTVAYSYQQRCLKRTKHASRLTHRQ